MNIRKIAFVFLYTIIFVLSGLFYWLFDKTENTASIIKNTLQKEDSLKSEIFVLQTNIQRYEIMMDKVKEEDSLLYEKVMFETE